MVRKKQSTIQKIANLINRVEIIGELDFKSINTILESVNLDRIDFVVISSQTSAQTNHPEYENDWLRETREFFNQACKYYRTRHHHILTRKNVTKYQIRVESSTSTQNFYNAGYMFVESGPYLKIKKIWEKILDKDNLLLSWARVRNEMSFATLEDTLEIRLFEINIHDRLEQLRCRLLSYDFESLGVEQMINYMVPKGINKTPRPMSICRLEEQILSVAILQVKADFYDDLPKNSYAYRLSKESQKENLYEDWFKSHTRFIDEARTVASQNPDFHVIQTDLSSYYTMIQQETLLEEFCHFAKLHDDHFKKIMKSLIIRDCGICSVDSGIPQGHVLSGALSNIYLNPIDHLFAADNDWGIQYFRYVDDMIFIFPPSIEPEFLLEKLDSELQTLGLKRSKDKTTDAMKSEDFLKLTALDQELNELGKKFNFLLASLYKLNQESYALLKLDWWKFIAQYQKLLSSIGVFISVPRLSRKVMQNYGYWKRVKNQFSSRVYLPQSKSFSEIENIETLKEWFSIANRNWVEKKRNIHNEIKYFFIEALSIISDPESNEQLKAKAKKRFKFSINRLGKLGFDELDDTIIEIVINRPWFVNVLRVCEDLALQGREDALQKIIEGTTSKEGFGFINACAIKALQSLPNRNCEINKLIGINDDITPVEKIMWSESIFFTKSQIQIQNEDLTALMERPNLHDALKRNLSLQIDQEILTLDNRHNLSIIEAMQFNKILSSQDFERLYCVEPDILREKFYQTSYPDDDSEFPDFPSWV